MGRGKDEPRVSGLGLGDIFQRVGARFADLFKPVGAPGSAARRRRMYDDLSPAQQAAVRRRRAANRVARKQRHVNQRRSR